MNTTKKILNNPEIFGEMDCFGDEVYYKAHIYKCFYCDLLLNCLKLQWKQKSKNEKIKGKTK